jgi:hypothetical protein
MNKTQIYNSNLCKEILLTAQTIESTLDSILIDGAYYAPYIPTIMSESKYKFSRAKWHEAKLPKDGAGAYNWCIEQFGPDPKYPDAWSRWYFNVNRTFRFRDSKDYEWFMLRWS